MGVSSIVDTWLLLRNIEASGERNRGVYVLKSRGMAHSNQIREFCLTRRGIELVDAYLGPGGVLTGSGRLAQEAQEQLAESTRRREIERRQRALTQREAALTAQIAALRAEFESDTAELWAELRDAQSYETQISESRQEMGRSRHDRMVGDGKPSSIGKRKP